MVRCVGPRAKNTTIHVEKGEDWIVDFWFLNPSGSRVNLGGSSFRGQIRPTKLSSSLTLAFTFSVNLTTNVATASLTGNSTSGLSAGNYVYDWEWIMSDGTVSRFQEGKLILLE